MKTKSELSSYGFSGLKTNNRRDEATENFSSPTNTLTKKSSSNPTGTSIRDGHSIFPGDLYPFLRKPLFLIIDSNNSIAFQNMPNLFGQPLVSLLSPVKLPTVFHGKRMCGWQRENRFPFFFVYLDYQNKGSLFTLFLTSPAFAFCFVCHLNALTNEQWTICQENVQRIMIEITKLFFKSKFVGKKSSSSTISLFQCNAS